MVFTGLLERLLQPANNNAARAIAGLKDDIAPPWGFGYNGGKFFSPFVMQIYLIRSQQQFEFHNQCSLLDFLEQQQIFHEYQCREGFCGSCRVAIKKGEVSYPTPPLAFINKDEILLCCCKVESDLELDL